jgi:Tfp pilus assembly protein PilO
MSEIKSWLRENQMLLGALIVQAIAIVAYAVKLETRVSTMETRGAAYTVQRMDEMKQAIAVLEEKIGKNEASIARVIEIMTKNLSVNPIPGGQK